jgi:2-phospho-L-lactate guanylyltransferase
VRVALIVPVKSFAIAKGRLASVMSEDARAQLAKECATRVLLAAGTWPTYVVCDDDDVTQWATQHGATVVHCTQPGINAAVRAGRDQALRDGIDHVVIAHGDLPLAHRFDHVVVDNTITLVPDRHHDGTNVLALPATSPFETTYGPQSFHRHVEQAHTLGLAHVIIEDEELSLDIDTADDVAELQTRGQSASNAKTQGSNT